MTEKVNDEYLPQKITKIEVTDFMAIQGTVTLLPSGNLLTVMGPNGAGKSSFIHALEECFDPQGTQGLKGITRPINDQATEARVKVTTTQAVIERVWKKNGPGLLTAKALDGATISGGAKAFVSEITGGLLFDPDDFLQLDEKAQRAQLLSKVDLPFDLDKINEKHAGFKTSRTDVTRDVKRLTAQLDGYAPDDQTLPAEELSAAALVKELDEVREHNQRFDGLAAAQESTTAAVAAALAKGKALQEALAEAKVEYGAAQAAEAAAKAEAATATRKDAEPISEKLASIDGINAKVRAQAARVALTAERDDRQAAEDDLNAKMTAIDVQKAEGLAAAKFPAGLSLDGDVIMHGGLVFRNRNKGLRDIIALDLATAGDPALKIVVMKSGNDLDETSMAYVQKLIDERGYFVIMERINGGGSDTLGFSIETPAMTE